MSLHLISVKVHMQWCLTRKISESPCYLPGVDELSGSGFAPVSVEDSIALGKQGSTVFGFHLTFENLLDVQRKCHPEGSPSKPRFTRSCAVLTVKNTLV